MIVNTIKNISTGFVNGRAGIIFSMFILTFCFCEKNVLGFLKNICTKFRQAQNLYKSTKKRIKNEKILEIVNMGIDLL